MLLEAAEVGGGEAGAAAADDGADDEEESAVELHRVLPAVEVAAEPTEPADAGGAAAKEDAADGAAAETAAEAAQPVAEAPKRQRSSQPIPDFWGPAIIDTSALAFTDEESMRSLGLGLRRRAAKPEAKPDAKTDAKHGAKAAARAGGQLSSTTPCINCHEGTHRRAST